MDQGFTDEAVVVIKRIADEVMVTLLRVKQFESDRSRGEGRNMKLTISYLLNSIVMRLAVNELCTNYDV